MSSNPYFVIASQNDDLSVESVSILPAASMPCNTGNGGSDDDEEEEESTTNSAQEREVEHSEIIAPTHSGHSIRRNLFQSLLSRNQRRRNDEEQCDPESVQGQCDYVQCDGTEPPLNEPQDSSLSVSCSSSVSEKENTNFLPRMCRVGSLAGRTVEISEHLVRVLFFDVIPWVVGCYVIFFAFRKGGLGLGFTAFLLLVSAHGSLKWWTARGKEKTGTSDDAEAEQEESNGSSNTNRHFHRRQCPHGRHLSHHHHHHNNGADNGENSTSDDDSSLEDELFNSRNVAVIVDDEPPPTYDAAANATLQDLSLGLDVHLKPKEATINDLLLGDSVTDNSANMYKHLLLSGLVILDESRRSSVLSTSSYISSEVDDESLPSYLDALQKIKRKKKRTSRNKQVPSEERQKMECDLLIDSRKCIVNPATIIKGDDIRIAVPPITTVVEQNEFSSNYSSIFSADGIVSVSNSSLDSCPSYHSDSAHNGGVRVNTTDTNSILFTDAMNRPLEHYGGSSSRHREQI